jgi:hypothetical protein
MGKYANSTKLKLTLYLIGGTVSFLNIWLLTDIIGNAMK